MSENRRRRRAGRRDFGSIKEDGTPTDPRFSVRWHEDGRMRRKRGFRNRTDAEGFLARTRVDLGDGRRGTDAPVALDVTVTTAIEAYGKHLVEKGNKPRPIEDRLYRLRSFFTDQAVLLSDLTPARCAGYYADLRCRVNRLKRPYSVDSHRSMLAEARMLVKWCLAKRWMRSNPVEAVEGKGKRRHGKPQLRIDEARRWIAKAMEIAKAGEAGAVAAMTALLLGMRASEIVSRVARDLDDEGRLLWIPHSKTEAGRRTLRVPDTLRPYLQQLAANKPPEALLFGEHWRDWPREWVQRICKMAGVPVVCAHSMRGLHSTLAMDAGVTGHVVAASLGHESVSTTIQSYAQAEAVTNAKQQRTLTVLSGGLS